MTPASHPAVITDSGLAALGTTPSLLSRHNVNSYLSLDAVQYHVINTPR